MCQIFVRANAQSYEATTRSIRLHGVVTSVRLENLFWDTLEEIAQRDAMHVPQLLSKLYDELLEHRGSQPRLVGRELALSPDRYTDGNNRQLELSRQTCSICHVKT